MTEENKKVLNADPRKAVEEMILITEEMMARMDIENNSLATNDGTSFAVNEPNKDHVTDVYERAAAEFHKRLGEFKKVDGALLDDFAQAQESLKRTAENNLKLLDKTEENIKKS